MLQYRTINGSYKVYIATPDLILDGIVLIIYQYFSNNF